MSEISVPAVAQRKKRLQLLLLLGLVLVPIIASYTIFLTGFGLPTGTSNKGILLTPPVSTEALTFELLDGSPWSYEENRKFRWVHIIDGRCDQDCRDLLITTRQVHIRLSERAQYVERLLINTGAELSPELKNYLAAEHVLLKVVNGDYAQIKALLGANDQFVAGLDGHLSYIMDRRGYLMMAYNLDHQGGELLEDMKFLLKTTR